jgi:hypothetical protein
MKYFEYLRVDNRANYGRAALLGIKSSNSIIPIPSSGNEITSPEREIFTAPDF